MRDSICNHDNSPPSYSSPAMRIFQQLLTSSTLKPETQIKKGKTDQKTIEKRAADKAVRQAVCI
ncbi:hypothetical protein PUMCH_002878 [Australozyma saopauloensis]|uniref:Uncharacterized protein n=1 Tax=Australozyma saopauloensis TaxID=291208 RepID=A0AAX4HAH5_9ASCO|nr:hypothetical protein PUMCH_002878 [[Candida] saopauloensis]